MSEKKRSDSDDSSGLTMWPLDPETAIRGALKVDPAKVEKAERKEKAKRKRRRKKRRAKDS